MEAPLGQTSAAASSSVLSSPDHPTGRTTVPTRQPLPSGVRTLGIEEELQLLDSRTLKLTSKAPQLLSRLPDHGYASELQRSTIEINTPVCGSLDELSRSLRSMRAEVLEVCDDQDCVIAASGTHPASSVTDLNLTAGGRFGRMQEDYRLLVDEHLVCSLQVHATVDDPDVAVRLIPRIEFALPTLLALSASSPFFEGRDTGYASIRAILWQRWPTAGRAPLVDSFAAYDRLLSELVESGTISDRKMAYFDVRPSAHLSTLELRICDACPLIDDAALIAGLFRAVVERAEQDERAGRPAPRIPEPLYRAAMWRAARSGLSDSLIDLTRLPAQVPGPDAVRGLAEAVRPQLDAAGDWAIVGELTAAALARGTSSDRQRTKYAETGRLTDVADLLVRETAGRAVGRPDRTRFSSSYPASSSDEAVDPIGSPYAAYRPVFRMLERFDSAELRSRSARMADPTLTFGVEGQQRRFEADLVPRVISTHEWAALAAGLTQRARAIEAYLRDIYGPARILRDGVIPADAISSCSGWRPEARLLPSGVVRAPVIGFDLVRDALGDWRVLEDNARVPSGIGYAIALRRLADAVLPELEGALPSRGVDGVLEVIARTLRHTAGSADATVALLSEGADNSGWYEHRLIAREVGLLLVQPSEVEIRDRTVVVGGKAIDVLYLRLAGELVDLVDVAGRAVGREIMEVARRGDVVLANAPGNGVADDKAMYCYVPDMIGYYLHERPLLAPVPTYRCADPAEREVVLDRLELLVTKPVGGFGGSGVLIGPQASRAELEDRRREIASDPAAWVAQEVVELSTLPTMVGGRLEPRHVDLRTFVYLTGSNPGDAELAGLALTRVAPAGSMVVNSSRGGGAKDTRVLVDPDARPTPYY